MDNELRAAMARLDRALARAPLGLRRVAAFYVAWRMDRLLRRPPREVLLVVVCARCGASLAPPDAWHCPVCGHTRPAVRWRAPRSSGALLARVVLLDEDSGEWPVAA